MDGQEFSDEELEIAARIHEVINHPDIQKTALKGFNRNVLRREVQKIDKLIQKIDSPSITSTNDLVYVRQVLW